MTNTFEIEDFRNLARKRIPRMFFDYVDSGSWTESTYHSNERNFHNILLRQRVARNVEHRSVSTSMLSNVVTMPVAIAPTGLAGMLYPDGEILAARAAHAFGVRYTLPMMSICSIEDVAANVHSPFWLQLYLLRDRSFIEKLIDRAKEAGCDALMLTLDVPFMARRHRDSHNRLSVPLHLTLANMLNILTKPRWCLGRLKTRRRGFGNIVGHVKDVNNMTSLAHWTAQQFDPTVTWDDVRWVKHRWGGKLILKGILDSEDAKAAIDVGADALVVSNHGGRQLDGAPSTIAALPAIVETVGSAVEVWLDSGIRSGQDVLKAIAMGARATLVGRPYLYGLAAMGESGVFQVLEIIMRELEMTMGLCGYPNIGDIDREAIYSISC